jgi:hypothetical protein
MSTAANSGTSKAGSRLAPFFVAFMAFNAALMMFQFATGPQQWHRWEFLGLAVAGAVSSRFKVKLPGVDGNMSVNLPFIFIAMTQLSVGEAMAVAAISVFIQGIPKPPHKFVPVQALFNVSTAVVAAGLGWYVFGLALVSHLNVAAALSLACATHFFASTVPVSVIISLTGNRPVFRTWSDILQLSFPYCLASTGLASIAAGVGGHTSWPMLIGIACVMFVTYRSYRMYFAAMRAAQANQLPTATRANAAGASN